MCCSYGVIPRSDPSFSLLPYKPSITPTQVHVPRSRVAILTRVGSFRTRSFSSSSSVHDGGSVASPPLTEELMSFYELLGISSEGTAVEIKQAYKQLARKYHPDVSPPGRVEEYTQRFIRVLEAYETLSDPGRRAMYDRDMARGIHLAFSARRRFQSDQRMEERGEWKNRWQDQLSELKRRSTDKDSQGNMSWGARMRRQRNDL
ncbi:hypothetical protein RHGRI_026122 [Rhododendron griersonianum]|uniref:J domain-containing protein n=1 Tax=Rhododendron griersonianum TaxID=479676 RepID=A0AAV6IV83_9ERIC|nr:hypothetical protein RHGRI_026122 [Rhododendron griersonianum]